MDLNRAPEHDDLRDRIGQVISDALVEAYEASLGEIRLDPFDSDNIDHIADAVLKVVKETLRADITNMADDIEYLAHLPTGGLRTVTQDSAVRIARAHAQAMKERWA